MAAAIGGLVGITLVVAVVVLARRSSRTPENVTPIVIRQNANGKAPEHAVLLHLRLSDPKFGTAAEVSACHALEERLRKEIERAGVGEMDGNEIGEGECVLFMYGPDADGLFATIASTVRAAPLAKGGWVIKRFGGVDDKNAKQVRIDL